MSLKSKTLDRLVFSIKRNVVIVLKTSEIEDDNNIKADLHDLFWVLDSPEVSQGSHVVSAFLTNLSFTF